MVFGDELVHGHLHGFLVHCVFHVEVEAALVGRDIAAGDAVLQHRPEQMHRRVHAHVPVATIPVEFDVYFIAGGGAIGALLELVAN